MGWPVGRQQATAGARLGRSASPPAATWVWPPPEVRPALRVGPGPPGPPGSWRVPNHRLAERQRRVWRPVVRAFQPILCLRARPARPATPDVGERPAVAEPPAAPTEGQHWRAAVGPLAPAPLVAHSGHRCGRARYGVSRREPAPRVQARGELPPDGAGPGLGVRHVAGRPSRAGRARCLRQTRRYTRRSVPGRRTQAPWRGRRDRWWHNSGT